MGKKVMRFIVKGNVQLSAFRSKIQPIAFSCGLSGQIQNINNPSKDVIIECEGESEKLIEFEKKLKELKENPKQTAPAVIKEIQTEYLNAPLNYHGFEIVRKEGEMSERMDEGVNAIYALTTTVHNGLGELKKDYGEISSNMQTVNENLKKLNDILEKLSGHLELIINKVIKK